MKITNIIVKKNKGDHDKNYLATVSIVLDYDLVVHNIKLMNGEKGEYLQFPVDNKGRFVGNPINEEYRQYLLKEILYAYNSDSSCSIICDDICD